MAANRTSLLYSVLGGVAAAALGTWILGSHIESPADAAARTAPPVPSPILVPVEQRALTSEVVTRGTARFGFPQPISIAPSALKSSPGLVTTIPVRNTQFGEGSVMLTHSGRPVFVFQGSAPAYRDLSSGIAGDDVRQLKRALKRLGFDPGAPDEPYDERTSAAVAAFYKSKGWEPFGPTREQIAGLRTIERDYAEAMKAKAAADAAQAAEREAKLAAQRAELGRAAEQAAKLEGEKSVQAAVDAEKLAALDAQIAGQRADQLAAELKSAKQKLGIQIPVDEVVFVKSLPFRVEAVSATVGSPLSGQVMTVTDNQLAVDASLTLESAPLVKPKMAVAIDEESLGVKAAGVVDFVDTTPGTHGVDGFHIYLAIKVNPTPVRLEGYSVRLKIPIESTKEAVTAVPVSALSLAPDGTSRVQVENNGVLKYVTVKPGLSSGGYVAVAPVEGTLSAGQRVVVGYNNPDA